MIRRALFRIRKSFRFEAAHQLWEGCFTRACSDCIHGHTYRVELFVTARTRDSNDMVVDFGVMNGFKEKVMKEWDHAVLLPKRLERTHKDAILKMCKKEKVQFLGANPTAETLALFLYQELMAYLTHNLETRDLEAREVRVEKVRVHETETGWAEYEEES